MKKDASRLMSRDLFGSVYELLLTNFMKVVRATGSPKSNSVVGVYFYLGGIYQDEGNRVKKRFLHLVHGHKESI